MSFKVKPIEGGKWELVLLDEPSYVHALKMAPDSIEAELNSGIWLVVAFPVWSGPVRNSVRSAIDCVKGFNGTVQFGIRPIDSFEEIYQWWPSNEAPLPVKTLITVQGQAPNLSLHMSSDGSTIPLWLLLRNGQVVYQGQVPAQKMS